MGFGISFFLLLTAMEALLMSALPAFESFQPIGFELEENQRLIVKSGKSVNVFIAVQRK
jgi:hypothetical protein